MSTYTFSNFPKAIVAFGNSFRRSDYEKYQGYLAKIKELPDHAVKSSEMVPKYGKYVHNFAEFVGKCGPVLSVLVQIVKEVDQLHNELKNVEQKIFNTILEGKLRALDCNLKNLESNDTNEIQRVAEIVIAISHFNEMLPVFANEDSIFRERFYQGALLFVRLCFILKAISLIAENATTYNNSNLHGLKQGYQKVLDWYRNKCIGRRMASCYVKQMLSIDGISNWTNDWDRHYKNYTKYYEESTSL